MTAQFKLAPIDVCININDRRDPVSSVKRWAIGNPYEHVFVYLGEMELLVRGRIIRIPMLFESDGDGVVIESLSSRYSQKVVVMRLKDRQRIPKVIEEAVWLAQDPQAKYDWQCIVDYILPRLICQKLGLPLPLKWHRNPQQVCSEAAFEIFYRAGLADILKYNCIPPMPGDFVTDSPLLGKVHQGILSAEWV